MTNSIKDTLKGRVCYQIYLRQALANKIVSKRQILGINKGIPLALSLRQVSKEISLLVHNMPPSDNRMGFRRRPTQLRMIKVVMGRCFLHRFSTSRPMKQLSLTQVYSPTMTLKPPITTIFWTKTVFQ